MCVCMRMVCADACMWVGVSMCSWVCGCVCLCVRAFWCEVREGCACVCVRLVRFPRYPRSAALRSVIVVVRILLAYGDNVRSGGPKMALL